MNNNELQQVKIESFTIGEDLPKIEVLEALSIDEMEQVVGGMDCPGGVVEKVEDVEEIFISLAMLGSLSIIVADI